MTEMAIMKYRVTVETDSRSTGVDMPNRKAAQWRALEIVRELRERGEIVTAIHVDKIGG